MDDTVPVVEALPARVAVWCPSREATSALLAAVASHSRNANTAAVVPVALAGGCPRHVALARIASDSWVTPVIVLALIALPPTMAWLAWTLAVKLVALQVIGAKGVTVTCLAAFAAGNFPVVGSAAIARDALYIWQAWALAGHGVTVSSVGVQAKKVAHTLVALLERSVSVVTRLAAFAVGTFCVVQTAQADARARVTVARLGLIDIAAAFTAPTGATRNVGFTIIVVGTPVAPFTYISLCTVTDNIASAWIQVTASGVVDTTVRSARAWARAAGDVHSVPRVSIVTDLTPVAVRS